MTMTRIVAIAGAGGSLGPSVVRVFTAAGSTLALAGRDTGKLDALLDSVGMPAGRRLTSSVDLLDESAARSWAADVSRTFGRVDTVVHLVGGYKGGTAVADISTADWNALHDMLVATTLNVVRAFVEPLKASGQGRFIAVTSPRCARRALAARCTPWPRPHRTPW
jgi:NADP-dependent 3-hydroxy acid dehydrogenase YdfG